MCWEMRCFPPSFDQQIRDLSALKIQHGLCRLPFGEIQICNFVYLPPHTYVAFISVYVSVPPLRNLYVK